MLGVACDEEAIVLAERLLEFRQTMLYALGSVVFVIDAFRSRWRGEVLVSGLRAGVSRCAALVSGVDEHL